jgi:hypothetical protein
VLILLMGVIYEVYRSDGLKWHDMHTEFYDDRLRHSSNIKVITAII